MKRTLITIEVISSLLIMLFIYASIIKYVDFATFKHDMFNQPFPHWFSQILIIILIPIEVGVALALYFDRSRLIGLYGAFVLMLLFTLYTALVLLHVFSRVPCSCGGIIKLLNWQQHLALNTFFTIASLIAIKLQKRKDKQADVIPAYS